jgi:hypothetical protein
MTILRSNLACIYIVTYIHVLHGLGYMCNGLDCATSNDQTFA